jgi:hypothetical protein
LPSSFRCTGFPSRVSSSTITFPFSTATLVRARGTLACSRWESLAHLAAHPFTKFAEHLLGVLARWKVDVARRGDLLPVDGLLVDDLLAVHDDDAVRGSLGAARSGLGIRLLLGAGESCGDEDGQEGQ